VADPQRFILKDKALPEALVRMLEGGKDLFLLTNSTWDYTNVIMQYLLDGLHPEFQAWRDYFTHIIVGAGKPGFFTGTQAFYEVMTNSNLLRLHQGELRSDSVYHGGNAGLFQELTGTRGDEILYIGDHLFGDIIRSKEKFNWRTMLCVEELADELPKLDKCNDLTHKIMETVNQLEAFDEDVQMLSIRLRYNSNQKELAAQRGERKKSEVLGVENEKSEERLQDLIVEREKVLLGLKSLIKDREERIHPVWGELMKVGLEKSRFAQQLGQYACLYTTRVSNIRFYSPFKRFTSPLELLPHDV
jgi:hypothetical protein